MNAKPESDPLLEAVLEETAPAEFRAMLLDATLREVRRRKQVRHLKQVCAIAIALLGFPLVLWKFVSQPGYDLQPGTPAFGIITSQPLPASMLVETQPGTVPIISSSLSTVSFIETDPNQRFFRELDDRGLLALVGDRPVILVRHHGLAEAEIVFVDPADQGGWEVR